MQAPVVLDPAPDLGIEHPRQVDEALVRPATDPPVPSHRGPDFLRGSPADLRAEACKVLTVPIPSPARPEGEAEKAEALLGSLPAPVRVLAVNDLRLLRMDLQPALGKLRFVEATLLEHGRNVAELGLSPADLTELRRKQVIGERPSDL